MNFPENIFKAYDIRGLADKELTEELFYRLGRAAIVFTRAKRVLVGYDMRVSSVKFKNALIRGLIDQGADAIDIGLCSTPIVNVMTAKLIEAELGIMITASHNPAQYNGCKFVDKKTLMPIGLGNGLDKIRDLVNKNEFVDASVKGKISEKNLTLEYFNFIVSLVNISKIKPLKIVIDFGNGVQGALIDEFMKKLPVQADYLFKEPDGAFPNHEANPLKYETLKDLQKRVVEIGADMGFAFDADADRVGLVDEKGEIVPADKIIALLAPTFLAKRPGASVVYEVKCGWAVKEAVEAARGVAVEGRVGRTLIIEKMRALKAVFGGELSGHFYYADVFNFESGEFTLLQILKLVSETGKTVSQLVAPYNKYFHSGEINFEVDNKEAIMNKLEEKYAIGAKRVSKLDGVKIEFIDWWFCARPSNTEPLLRLTLEARTEQLMQQKVKEISGIIQA